MGEKDMEHHPERGKDVCFPRSDIYLAGHWTLFFCFFSLTYSVILRFTSLRTFTK